MSFDRSLLAMPDRSMAIDMPMPSTDFRRPMRVGLAVIAIAFGGFGTWAALAPLDSAVVAPGVVAVESKRKVIQHREGGIVAQVLVKEGDAVPAGTILVRLEDSGAQAHLDTLKLQYDMKRAEQARLIAERDGRENVAFPGDLEQARGDARVAETLAREEDRFSQRRKSIDGQRSILEARIAQLESQHGGRSKLEESKRAQFESLKVEIEGLRQLTKKGYFPRNRLAEKERELARMEGEMLSDGAGADQSVKEIAENRLQILQLEQKFREDVVAQLATNESEVNDIGTKLVAARDAVERLAVVAPVAGTVQGLKIAGPGAVVPPGGEIAEIVPESDSLVIETRINPRDIDRVGVGQQAKLRFSTLGTKATPVISGEVEVVSADSFTDQQTQQTFYTARVEVPEAEAALLPQAMKAGMPVEVMLQGGERTALQYLLKPLLDSFAHSFKER